MRRSPALLLAACLLASACLEALPAPPPAPSPSAPAPLAAPFLEERVPIAADLRIELPPYTTRLDASGGTLFGVQYLVNLPRGFHLVAAQPPAPEWRTVYASRADGNMNGETIGDDTQRTFIEQTFGLGSAAFEVLTVEVATGTARRLDRSTLPSPLLSRLSQRARPTVVGSGELVAWTRLRAEGDGFIWEMYETSIRAQDASPRLVRRSDQPLVPLAFDGRLVYVVVGPERDELWIYDRTTGEQATWPTTAAGISAAAWSEAGLIVATIDPRTLGAINTVAIVDERGTTWPIVNATPCARPMVSGRYLTWSCSGGSDLRAFDLRSGTFPLVAHSSRVYDFRVSGGSFVWTDAIAGKSTAHLLMLAP